MLPISYPISKLARDFYPYIHTYKTCKNASYLLAVQSDSMQVPYVTCVAYVRFVSCVAANNITLLGMSLLPPLPAMHAPHTSRLRFLFIINTVNLILC